MTKKESEQKKLSIIYDVDSKQGYNNNADVQDYNRE